MSAFVDPQSTEELEVDGVIFLVRALTAREKFSILASADEGINDQMAFGTEAMDKAVCCGLVGWKGMEGKPPPPEWSRSKDVNVDRLSDTAYLAIGQKVINLTFLSAEDKKK